jgi:acyl carrier protein
LEQQLRTILDEVGGLRKPAETLGLRDDLFAAGLTSFATVGVMLAIEDEFGVAFPDELLVRATFRSIESLSGAIAGLSGEARAA